ncbi:MAG: tyrosine-type recombinase/integrase [Armatimonadota bacterium]
MPKNLTCCYRDILIKAGLRHIRFHDLRHTHATIMLSQNVHPMIVSERLGHSAISITLDTYSHVLPNMQADAVRQFDDAFGTALNKKSGED